MTMALVFLSLGSLQAYAEYSEVSVKRPQSSGQHQRSYFENDKGQLQASLSSGRVYNVYLPGGATKTEVYKRPAILLLHGAGRSGASLVERWREIADRKGVILLGPHAEGQWKAGTDGQGYLTDVINDAIEKYNINPDRLYLFGHSMGGNMALVMAFTNQNRFAAIGVHAGNIPQSIYHMVEKTKRKTPIIIVNGNQDAGFPIDLVRRTARHYAEYGHDVELYVLLDHGHWYYDVSYAINDLVWDFFRSKSL